MNAEPSIHSHSEALTFIASRLLNFKRIHYRLFRELIGAKYDRQNTEELFQQIMSKKGAYLHNEMLVVANEEVLKKFEIATGMRETAWF